MIRDGKKLPANVTTKIPAVTAKISADEDVVAFYIFGSLARGNLKPLSDLDFGILLSRSLDRKQRFDKHLDLVGIFTETLKTDEVDLVILNDAPLRFARQILSTGKLFFCRDQNQLVDFIEETNKRYLEFKPALEQFDQAFLEGIGYSQQKNEQTE
jgi:hypothetical protein